MRIIAGMARGRRLLAPQGDRVRPTLDRVRESLFNILSPRLEGARFLDLYAGSGANGIEALSRGATSAFFIDNHPDSAACIQKNLDSTGLSPRGRVMRIALPSDLKRLTDQYDIVFADPPYGFQAYEELLLALCEARTVAPDGVVVIEHLKKMDLPPSVGRLSQTQVRHYGSTALSFYA